jgi:acetyl-CoA acyltransferase
MPTAVIVDAIRTPGGKRNGKLKNWHAVDLASEALRAIASRNNLDPALIDDVIMGCVSQTGEQAFNVGRNAVLAAGWPESVPATTIDRQCGSSQQALHFAAQGVMSGAYDIVVAAGVEVMSRVAMGSSIGKDSGFPFGPRVMARYEPVGGLKNQGIGAEMIADQWGISREDLDAFSAESHRRAAQATAEGRFEREIIPIYVRDEDGQATDELMTADEGIRPNSTLETLGNLKPAFKEGGKVTAGNSSQITDGASAVLIMSEEKARELGYTPRAKFHSFALAGVDRTHPRHHEGPRARRPDARRHRPGRDQRGLRLGDPRLAEGAQRRPLEGERQRRRHRPGPPLGSVGRQAVRDTAERARAHRRSLRADHDVRGRRTRQRHDHRTPRLDASDPLATLGPLDRYRATCTGSRGRSR